MRRARTFRVLLTLAAASCAAGLLSIQLTRPLSAAASSGQAPDAKTTYDQIKAFSLTGGSADVAKLTLKRDRVEMTFTGTFYFAAPVGGKVTGAVFVGDGRITANVPPSEFERENLRRMTGAELVESDFKTVVLRWSDDTFSVIGAAKRDGAAVPAQAQKLAAESEGRFLQETGANLSARIALSMVNNEAPGIFTATFDGGRRGRFSVSARPAGPHSRRQLQPERRREGPHLCVAERVLHQRRLDGVLFAKATTPSSTVEYSDTNDVVDITHYRLNVDLRDVRKQMGVGCAAST